MNSIVNLREYRGQQLSENPHIRIGRAFHYVPSQTSGKTYKVDSHKATCTCADYLFSRQTCKHIYAVWFLQGREMSPASEFPVRAKHSQDWSSYNRSQVTEKATLLNLLSELTGNIQEPEMQSTGRPSLPLSDMIFSCIFKTYIGMSSRRFSTDLADAHDKGFISECPAYNSLNRYMKSEALTPYLEALVTETAKPLASLETDFAIDSTGLSTSNTVSWYHAKYKDAKMIIKKDWLKLHCCIGVNTHVITAIEISDRHSNDMNHFIPVLEATRRNFNVEKVMADKAYSSMHHFAYTEANKIDAFIPFRDNAIGESRNATSVWKRMYHYFNLNRAEFLQHYGRRENVESAFHSLKSKFGATLKSKSATALKNEALCIVIGYNLTRVIHAMNEFGIEPGF